MNVGCSLSVWFLPSTRRHAHLSWNVLSSFVKTSDLRNVHQLGNVESDQMLCSLRRRATLFNRARPGRAFAYRFDYWFQAQPIAEVIWSHTKKRVQSSALQGTQAIPIARLCLTITCHIWELPTRTRSLLFLVSQTSWRMAAAVAFGAWQLLTAPISIVVKLAMHQSALATKATEPISTTRSGPSRGLLAPFGRMWQRVEIQTAEIHAAQTPSSHGRSLKVVMSPSCLAEAFGIMS